MWSWGAGVERNLPLGTHYWQRTGIQCKQAVLLFCGTVTECLRLDNLLKKIVLFGVRV